MKNIILLIVMVFTASLVSAQKENTDADTTKLKLGNKTIMIIEKNEETGETVLKQKEITDEEKTVTIDEKNKKGMDKPHYSSRKYSRWAGLYLGVNQLGDIGDGGPLSIDMQDWQINPWKSRIWNINFMEMNLSIIKKHILLTTGFGLEYKNYSFTENIDLVEDKDNRVNPEVNNNLKYKTDKLHVSYFQMPILLEFNTSSKAGKGIYLAAGVVGGLRMYSKLYQKYDLGDNTIKRKTKSDFNLNPYQLYATLRLGFNKITFFGNFDLIPLFKEDRSQTGDNLMAISAGVKLVGF